MILLKLTHYSFYTDRVLSSTFLAICSQHDCKMSPPVKTCLLSAPPSNIPDQVLDSVSVSASKPPPRKPKNHPLKCSCTPIQASLRTQCFQTLDPTPQGYQSTLTTSKLYSKT